MPMAGLHLVSLVGQSGSAVGVLGCCYHYIRGLLMSGPTHVFHEAYGWTGILLDWIWLTCGVIDNPGRERETVVDNCILDYFSCLAPYISMSRGNTAWTEPELQKKENVREASWDKIKPVNNGGWRPEVCWETLQSGQRIEKVDEDQGGATGLYDSFEFHSDQDEKKLDFGGIHTTPVCRCNAKSNNMIVQSSLEALWDLDTGVNLAIHTTHQKASRWGVGLTMHPTVTGAVVIAYGLFSLIQQPDFLSLPDVWDWLLL